MNKDNLYLRADCIDWLLSYGADELAYQGVEAAPATPPCEDANCDSVENLRLEWDFHTKTMIGKLVAGPAAGTTKELSIKDIS